MRLDRSPPSPSPAIVALLTLATLLASGCDDHRGTADTSPTTLPVLGSSAPVGSARPTSLDLGSAAPLASGSPSGSAGPSAPGEVTAGSWTGTYEAKKSSITLPSKAKPDALGVDDGKSVVGPGTIEINVDALGELTGKIAGSLGPGTLVGKVDAGMLRASIQPNDPRAAHAMTGVLIGVVKGDAILCDLHAAGPDGGSIRESSVQLARKR